MITINFKETWKEYYSLSNQVSNLFQEFLAGAISSYNIHIYLQSRQPVIILG